MKEPVYITFANKIAKMIDSGIYKSGDKLPSIRSLHKKKLKHQHRAEGIAGFVVRKKRAY